MFPTLLRAHFNPRLTARAKVSLSRAHNIFMPANINSIVLLKAVLLMVSRNIMKKKSELTEVKPTTFGFLDLHCFLFSCRL